jgi:hypothetical protein
MERRSAIVVCGCRVRLRPRLVRPRQQLPELLGLLRGAVDEAVDRLEADRAEPALLAPLQPAGDLLRRPPLQQALADEAAELGVTLENGRALPALEVAALGVDRQVAAAG